MDRFLDLFGPLGVVWLRLAPQTKTGESIVFKRRFIHPLSIVLFGLGASVLAVGIVGMVAGSPPQHTFGPALLISIPLLGFAGHRSIMTETVSFHEDGAACFSRKCIPWGRSFESPWTINARISMYGVVTNPRLFDSTRSKPKYFMAVAFVNQAVTPLAFMKTEDAVREYLAELPDPCQIFVDVTERTASLQSTLRGRLIATPARSILATPSD